MRFSLLITLLVFFLHPTNKLNSQTTILAEGFENQFPANGWSIRSYTPLSNDWIQYNNDFNSGLSSAAVFPNVNNANSWLFSGPLQLSAGKIYVLKYFVKIQSAASLIVSFKEAPDYNSNSVIIRSPVQGNPGTFTQIIDTFTCEISGTRYLAFQNNSAGPNNCGTLIDDVSLTELSQLPECTIPAAGTVSSIQSTSCIGGNITLNLSNISQNSKNIRYSWQSSVDGVVWSNITNGYSFQRQLLLNHPGLRYYRHTDTCLSSGNTATSNVIQIQSTPFLSCLCTPSGQNCFSLSITNVTLHGSTINNTSTCSAGGYSNYSTAGSATVYKGHSVPIQLTITNTIQVNYSVGIWADLNHNGSFDESEFFTENNLSYSSNIFNYFIPTSAETGETRLRIKIRYYTNNQPIVWGEACSANAVSGETEDYKIVINDASSCSGAISAGSLTAAGQVCPNSPFLVSATGATGNQNQMRYSWQRSSDNISWANITNTSYIINPLQVSQNTSYYYRLTDTCTASGQSSVSQSIQVTNSDIFSCYCVPANSVCTNYGIDSVSVGTIRNGSNSCSIGGYGNFTNLSTTHSNGSLVPFYIKIKPNILSTYVWLLLDLNRNGVFENSERLYTGITQSAPVSGTIVIPFNVPNGEMLLRIITNNSGLYTTACTTNGIGEIEDYKIIINQTNPVTNKFSFYVKQTATPGNNGLSWATAFNSLQTALTASMAGDTIKVAKGIYTPGTNNTQYFSLKDSVILLGGFPDIGNPSNSDRNISVNQTILSGEIGTTSVNDNSRMILYFSGIKGTILDGFIIEKGFENSSGNEGPVLIYNSNVTISRCVIRNNINGKNAGGLNIINSGLLSLNNVFENNLANGFDSTASVISAKQGSAIDFINNVITKNKTKYIVNLSDSKMNLLNSTVFKNTGYNIVHDTSTLTISNSVFFYNGSGYVTDTSSFYKDVYSELTISHTITENYFTTSGPLFSAFPKFTDTSKIAGADNFYFTSDDGLTLLNPCSPAINAGLNENINNISFDITGRPRIKNTVVDLGAYEVQEPLVQQPSVLYVNKIATGLNNGTNWQNAFTDLQSAFNSCSDTIKVASSIYPVSLSDENAYYQLSNNRVVIGGYPNTGNPDNTAWNPTLYQTVIDGTINSSTKNSVLVVSVNNDSTCRFIGFSLQNSAPFSLVTGQNQSTLKISHKSTPVFQQLKLDPSTTFSVNLITIQSFSNPVFKTCSFFNTIVNQTSTTDIRSINITTGSNPVFTKCYLGADTTSNTPGITGSPVRIRSAAAVFDSCIFNRASNDVLSLLNADVLIQNTRFKLTKGRTISSNSSNLVIKNCQFTDSIKPVSAPGGLSLLTTNSNATFEKCEFRNSFTHNVGSVSYVENSTAIYNSCYFNAPNLYGYNSVIYNKSGSVYLHNCVNYMKHKNQYGDRLQSGNFITNEGQAVVEIRNSTLVGHSYYENPMVISVPGSRVKIYNSILWRYGSVRPNTTLPNDITTGADNDINSCDIRNSMLFKQLSTTLTNSTAGINPRLTDISNPEGLDRIMYTVDDGLSPCSCSPAINSGQNILNQKPTDFLNGNRILNGAIDRGAYELTVPATENKVYFVKPGSSGGNGLSWTTAYNNPQQAILNSCADTIKVAQGVYKPAVTSRDSSFTIYNGVVLLGGYPNTGNPSDSERNPTIYPTQLSGDIGIQNDSLDNTYHVVKVSCPDTTVIIDGFSIIRGNANSSIGTSNSGGGVLSEANRKLILRNCNISTNYASIGAGLASTCSNLFVDKTVLQNNNSQNYGGGFFVQDYYEFYAGQPTSTETRFTNSVISNNKGLGGLIFGASVVANSPNITFKNTVFYKNEGEIGAGLKISDHSFVDIINCSFISNNTLSNNPGIGLFCSNQFISSGLGTRVINSIFKNNTFLGQPTTILNNDFNWSNGTNQYETIPWYNLQYSVISGSQTGAGQGNIPESWVQFRNIDAGQGLDNIWRTQDDGLQVTDCSYSIDKGENTVTGGILTDITDSIRIRNNIVDIGPYEKESFKVAIQASDSLICNGQPVTCTATVTGAGASAIYIWTVNGVPVGTNSPVFTSSSLLNNDKIQLKIKNQTCSQFDTAYSNIITFHSGSSLTPVAYITASDTAICENQPVTFSASVTPSNITTVYQWKVNGSSMGTNSPVFNAPAFTDGSAISVEVTLNASCLAVQTVNSNVVIIHVTPSVTPQVSISGTPNPTCSGSPVIFTATAVHPGNTPAYQWMVNGIDRGSNTPVFTTATLQNNDLVTVKLTSSETCVNNVVVQSNAVQIQTTAQLTPVLNITAGPITCPGLLVSLTANAVNAGSSPQIIWRKNSIETGITGNTFSSTQLIQGDVIDAILISSASCISQGTVTSNIIAINYTAALIPSVSISTGQTTICAGASATFTAQPVNGGSSPSVRWYVNNVFSGSTGNTFTINTLNNNDQVKAQLTSSATCVTTPIAESNTIIMQVSSAATPTLTISANQTNICSGTNVTFTASPVNGGTSPTYQWFLNNNNTGQTGNSFSSNTLNNNDQVKAVLTSSSPCVTNPSATSNVIAIQVTNIVTPSVTIVSTQNSICPGTSVTFTASPVNGGTNPVYQWQINGTNTGANNAVFTSTTLGHNDQVKVIMTSNAFCINPATVSSNIITILVSASVTPSVNIISDKTSICSGSPVTFTATPVNGGATPVYLWQLNGSSTGTNNPTYITSTLNNNDQVRVVMTSNASCVSPIQVTSNSINISVTSTFLPTISISGTTSVTAGQVSVLVSAITNGGSAPIYTWQDSTAIHNWQNIAGGNTATLNYSASTTGDKVRCLLTSNASCPNPAQITSNWLQFVVSPITGINQVPGNIFGISIYPNPTESIVYIDSLKSSDKWTEIQVVNLNGVRVIPDQQINNRSSVIINVNVLPAGYYLVILHRKQGNPAFLKFIKQ